MPAHLIAEEGPQRGSLLNLEDGEEWIIGRDPDTCDFVIEDSTVSRRHARLNAAPDGVYLKNLSRVNPTLINDEEHKKAVLLKEGDKIQIGNTVFLFSEEDLPNLEEKSPPKPKAKSGGYDDIFGDLESPSEELLSSPKEEEEIEEEEEAEKSAIEPEELRIPPAPPKPEMTAYDTIFEDTGVDEDIPFNLLPEAPLLLKVIAGPNAGAEIGIEKGRVYTIGKDPNSCDIVFQDLSVSRHHAKLTVNNDGTIEIEDLSSKNGTAVNGSILKEKAQVTPQDIVALGTTVFMIVDREAPQDTIFSPIVPTYEHTRAKEDEDELELEAKEADWKKRPIPMKHLIMAGSAAAVFLIVFLSFFSLFKSSGIDIVQKEPTSEIKEALAKYDDVQFSFNPASGKLFLVGHVLTPVDYQEMNYRLEQIPFIGSIEDTVVIDEGVWKMMNDIISTTPTWRGVSIHSPKAGKFVINGYIDTTEDAMKLYEYLTVNFPYLDRLENNIVVEETLNEQIKSMIAQEHLGAVSFRLTNGNVVITGQYSETMDAEFKKMMKEINKVKGVTLVQNYATPIHPNRVGIDLSNQYQVSGSSTYDGRGFSVVMNGKVFTLGDHVDGMKITSIEPSTILLEKEGLKYKIDYTGR